MFGQRSFVPRGIRRRAALGSLLAGALGATAAASLLSGSAGSLGCTTRQCVPSMVNYYGGFMEGPTTFVSTSLTGPWLPFHSGETIVLYLPKTVAGWTPKAPVVYVGTDPQPNGGAQFMGGDQYIQASGQLAYLNFLNTFPVTNDAGTFGGNFWVTNSTCAEYFMYVQVDFIPPEGEAGPVAGATDGGSEAAADGEIDAGIDANASGPADASVPADGSDAQGE